MSRKKYKYPKYAVPLNQESKNTSISVPKDNDEDQNKELDISSEKVPTELKLGRPKVRIKHNRKISPL